MSKLKHMVTDTPLFTHKVVEETPDGIVKQFRSACVCHNISENSIHEGMHSKAIASEMGLESKDCKCKCGKLHGFGRYRQTCKNCKTMVRHRGASILAVNLIAAARRGKISHARMVEVFKVAGLELTFGLVVGREGEGYTVYNPKVLEDN